MKEKDGYKNKLMLFNEEVYKKFKKMTNLYDIPVYVAIEKLMVLYIAQLEDKMFAEHEQLRKERIKAMINAPKKTD